MATYVPRVLICGDIEEFKIKIGDKPVEIVGQINFSQLDKVQLDAADFLICTDAVEFFYCCKKFPQNEQFITLETFAKKIYENFLSKEQFVLLESAINYKNYSLVLDFDACLAKSDFHMPTKDFNVEVDCVVEKIYPIMENVYRKIYRSFNECKFHHFDAVILGKERTPEDFIDVLIKTDALSENIFAFVRKNSALEKFLAANENIFAAIERFEVNNGAWCHIKKIVPPTDVGVYVVTHKDAKLSALPAGYKFIHAGHALAKKDFGYAGDDTGNNISRLNPFLDEVTALYWIWKNTTHTHAGLVHYRRFFTDGDDDKFSCEKILSATEILKILSEYDIIVSPEGVTNHSQRDEILLATGQLDLVNITEKILRNHLARKQPDYLDAFDDVLNGIALFTCNMFITRRNIFNAYCEWLFSFLIDATEEVRDKIQIGDKNLEQMGHIYSRIVGHFDERLLTVWLMKNHLRIKSLPIMKREDI